MRGRSESQLEELEHIEAASEHDIPLYATQVRTKTHPYWTSVSLILKPSAVHRQVLPVTITSSTVGAVFKDPHRWKDPVTVCPHMPAAFAVMKEFPMVASREDGRASR